MEVLRHPSIFPVLNSNFRRLLDVSDGLDELLIPHPQLTAEEIFRNIQESDEGTVNLVYSLSMFSGKTRAAIKLSTILNEHNIPVLGIQPANGIRFGESQESSIMTHQLQNPESMPALKTNLNFGSVLEIAKKFKEDNKNEKTVLIIDEGMFFFDHLDHPDSAEKIVEDIRKLGIHIVITGITRTYQTTPFIVMDHLVNVAGNHHGWNTFEMTTQCAFCTKRAKGTARYVRDNGNIRLATLEDPFYEEGSSDKYVQVCVDKHPSFAK